MTPFTGLSSAQLASLQAGFLAAILAVSNNQSYTLNGRSLTRANLNDLVEKLGWVNAEIADLNGTTASETVVNFTGVGGPYA